MLVQSPHSVMSEAVNRGKAGGKEAENQCLVQLTPISKSAERRAELLLGDCSVLTAAAAFVQVV